MKDPSSSWIDRSVETSRIAIPARPIRVFAAETLRDVNSSIAAIEAWMKRTLPAYSRFHQAVVVLKATAESGWPESALDQQQTIRAIQLALDLSAIVEALPKELSADHRRALEACAAGPLVPPAELLTPLQAQSELVLRAAFLRAGVVPGHLTHAGSKGGSKPDILIENGTITYGLEVKRPTHSKNVQANATKAADQLRNARLTGGMMVDVTDCLEEQTAAAAEQAVVEHAEAIADLFFTHGQGWKPGFSHILVAGVMARPAWHFTLGPSKEGEVQSHSVSCIAAFGSARGSLDTIRSNWIRDRLNVGLNRLGFTSTEINPPAA